MTMMRYETPDKNKDIVNASKAYDSTVNDSILFLARYYCRIIQNFYSQCLSFRAFPPPLTSAQITGVAYNDTEDCATLQVHAFLRARHSDEQGTIVP